LIVGQYTRVLVAVVLQQIADMVDHEYVWAMSLVGDGSTHRGQSFFNMHLRIYYHDNLWQSSELAPNGHVDVWTTHGAQHFQYD
jgi:hypothetical protein